MGQLEQTQSNAAQQAEEEFSPLAELGVATPQRTLVRRLLHYLGLAVLFAYFGFAALVLALRFWLLPYIEDRPDIVAGAIARSIGQRVSIGSVDTGWQGLRPYLALTELRLYDGDDRPALSLPSVTCTLSWNSLAFGSLRLHSLSLDKAELNMRRDKAGAVYVAGVRLNSADSGAGFSNWLLAQREVIVRGAHVNWDDQLRGAPALSLADLNFVLRNRGDHHRFALRAQPPRELAAALDLRGDLQGATFEQLQAWNGRLYAEFAYTDLAAWRNWLDLPLQIERGRGGLRMWLGFANRNLTQATADVALGDISARLAPDLPLLEMRVLQGRLSAKLEGGRYEFGGQKVEMQMQSGLFLPPAKFSVQWRPAEDGREESGQLRIDALQLQPLAQLGEYLPLPQQLRSFLAEAAPQGGVSDMQLDWDGALPRPRRFSARGHFEKLGMRAYAGLPGIAGFSGNVDGNEKGGNLLLNAADAEVDLPGVFVDPARKFDTLTAQIAWSHARDGLQLKFSNIAFANTEVAGTAFGSYTAAASGPGLIDLTARLNRADARHAPRYIPFLKNAAVLDWLDQSLLAGRANDVSLRFKGDLKNFPFRSSKDGVFQISAKVSDGALRYADGWPSIDDIDAELHFSGARMEIVSRKARVLGAKVTSGHVVLPDLFASDRVLAVNGQAEGPTAEFLKFIAQSPVDGYLGGITANMGAVGAGKLQLKLALPLARMQDVKVAGSYQLLANQVSIEEDWPPISQVSGRLDFSESTVNLREVNAQFLGGPVAISVASQRDGAVAVNARGTLNAAALAGALEQPLLRQLSGNTAWNSSMLFRRSGASILVESRLQGLSSSLPAPLAKSGAEVLPLRFEHSVSSEERPDRWSGSPTRDRSSLQLGKVLRMEVQRRREGANMVVERAAIGLNEAPRLPESGVVLNGSATALDLDEWLKVLGASGAGHNPLTALNLRVGALDVYGKRINDVALRAGFQGSDWLANIEARELAGDVRWRAAGKGRISAQLSHFTFPEPTPGKHADDTPPKELPGLEITADNLVVRDKKLGRLVLVAANAGLDWRIEKLTLTTPESLLNAEGVWQGLAEKQRTKFDLKLEVSDVGKYLARVGFPGSMQGGKAKLLGKLAWNGSPQNIDYPTLAGDISLIAEKGQFLKIEPGIGKLLGILSLQALPRRITLDFRDIFSDGFAFDTITGTAAIEKGMMRTKDFVMHGPSAQVAMTGSIDLVSEAQSLRVRVVPSVGDSLSVAGIVLAHPIAGVATFLAQRLFKDPLGQALAFEYAVTGTWLDPKVEKLAREQPDSAPGDGR